jgi:hypothetical protein
MKSKQILTNADLDGVSRISVSRSESFGEGKWGEQYDVHIVIDLGGSKLNLTLKNSLLTQACEQDKDLNLTIG